MSDWQIITGDCLEILNKIPAASADAIIADPPYGINTKSDGTGKINPWADRINAAYWYREWIAHAQRIIKPSGCLWSFMNWRSMVTFQKAADDLGWPIESVLIWDKCWIGPGGQRGLRPSYEMVALWAGNDFSIDDRGLPDIQQFKWSSVKPNGHPAEKPIDLLRWIVTKSTKRGDLIIDPFMGSGTTGAAAILEGRRFIGIELDPRYAESARRRLEIVQPALFAEAPPIFQPAAEQPALMGI